MLRQYLKKSDTEMSSSAEFVKFSSVRQRSYWYRHSVPVYVNFLAYPRICVLQDQYVQLYFVHPNKSNVMLCIQNMYEQHDGNVEGSETYKLQLNQEGAEKSGEFKKICGFEL